MLRTDIDSEDDLEIKKVEKDAAFEQASEKTKLKQGGTDYQETFDNKVAAVFDSEADVHDTFEQLVDKTSLSLNQIRVVRPKDPALSKKLEPETTTIGRRWYWLHTRLSAIGLLVGLAVGLLLWLAGPEFVQQTDWRVMIPAASIGLLSGFIAATVFILQPSRNPFIDKLSSAVSRGSWALVVHAKTKRQQEKTDKLLQRSPAGWVIS